MNFIKDLLKEQSGKYSSNCIKNSKIEDIPNGVYMISGVIFGTQALGKFGETK